ncbi:Upstream stimulatory factor 2 [Trichinella britovi]|uniref:Upstream stimulatory factor 2 n=2 Tax=Trichinella TaxID=6333 RepID=A0A0V1CM91_TRIBR|nr:Upstream stimulatory factor 2 [Trichinella murrelli]KRX56853.1 Upstream stimulatory factor 2 [Trichinella sp. T9]KRY49859.1 Upstream stimulatory factor 2 [Trichinella britovi]KRZ85816.1 Upstream stimulatory factor 2 [Trichinella sp. T8]
MEPSVPNEITYSNILEVVNSDQLTSGLLTDGTQTIIRIEEALNQQPGQNLTETCTLNLTAEPIAIVQPVIVDSTTGLLQSDGVNDSSSLVQNGDSGNYITTVRLQPVTNALGQCVIMLPNRADNDGGVSENQCITTVQQATFIPLSFLDSMVVKPSDETTENIATVQAEVTKKPKQPLPQDVHRRASHNLVERRRRSGINGQIRKLARLLPDWNEKKKDESISSILAKTVEYIKQLKEESMNYQLMSTNVVNENMQQVSLHSLIQTLRSENEEMKRILQMHNIPFP